MNEESKQEKEIREISENKNPYAQECPNRHLYSEGFRAGYFHAISSPKNEFVKADVIGAICPRCRTTINHFSMYENKCLVCGSETMQTGR